jgi:hypothetical protein
MQSACILCNQCLALSGAEAGRREPSHLFTFLFKAVRRRVLLHIYRNVTSWISDFMVKTSQLIVKMATFKPFLIFHIAWCWLLAVCVGGGVWGCGGVGVWWWGVGGWGVVSPCVRTFQGLHSVRLWTPTIFIKTGGNLKIPTFLLTDHQNFPSDCCCLLIG